MHVTLRKLKIRTIQILFNFGSKYWSWCEFWPIMHMPSCNMTSFVFLSYLRISHVLHIYNKYVNSLQQNKLFAYKFNFQAKNCNVLSDIVIYDQWQSSIIYKKILIKRIFVQNFFDHQRCWAPLPPPILFYFDFDSDNIKIVMRLFTGFLQKGQLVKE